MAEYTWAFDVSFLVFLVIAFLSLTAAVKVKSIIPMPLIYGILFAAGFGTGILPKDMMLSANMTAVGTIAFHVLVIHSGTMINLKLLAARKKEAALCAAATLVLVLVTAFGLMPFLGKGISFLAPGSVVGGGASCAIASRWILDKQPALSVFPWLVFMFQGLFSVPVVTLALKKESRDLLEELHSREGDGKSPAEEKRYLTGKEKPPAAEEKPHTEKEKTKIPLCGRIPGRYKNTAYYLGIIMLVSVVNSLLQKTVWNGLNINPNITALIFGLILGSAGLMDRAPLFRSDSYGLLLLGLMGLMANTLANCPWQGILAYLPALLLVFVVSTVVLVLCGIAGARIFHFRPARGIILTMNCMMGFPVNDMLVENAAGIAGNDREKSYLKSRMGPLLGIGTMLISNAVSILIVSIMVILI